MLKLVKTALLSGALIALTALPAAAQGERTPRCGEGGHMVNGRCELPGEKTAPPATPAPEQRRGAQEGNQGAQTGGRAGAQAVQQGTVQPNNVPQETGRGGRGQAVVPQGNVQQGSVQQGEGQRGRGAPQQQGSLQQGTVQPAPVQPQQGGRQGGPAQNGVQQGNNRNNNFGQRDNGPYGNNNGQYGNNNFGQRDQRDNGQYGNNNDQYRNNNGQFGSNYSPYGSNSGRNFDQNEFNRRYYGRYGSDPNNFQRNRQAYRVAQRWHESYPHDYVYADDSFYRDCRSNNEVGGAIVGAILGGILGNAVSHGQGGATLAGVIIGGVGGASLAGNLDCEDRSYVYRTYYDGFERGRSRASYPWRNDRTGDYGTLLVGDYYQDRDNYRCATYTQTIYVRGRPQVARGHACRQNDGTWALVD